jgi:hypothetical protein
LWGTTPKDAFAGKWVVFLALEIDSRGDGGSLEQWYCVAAVLGAYSDMIVYVNIVL